MPQKQKENIVLPKSTPAERERKRQMIGILIKEKREAMEITIDNFAYEAGVSRSNLIRVENGQNPSIETLLIILHSLSITEADFFILVQERLAAQKASEKKSKSQ